MPKQNEWPEDMRSMVVSAQYLKMVKEALDGLMQAAPMEKVTELLELTVDSAMIETDRYIEALTN